MNSDARLISFIGDSDTGKSSMMRAFRSLFLLDTVDPSYGERNVELSATFEYENGTHKELKREIIFDKQGKIASNIVTWNGVPYSKLGRMFPEAVAKEIGICYLPIENFPKFSLNFIGQFDAPLTKALSPGQMSKLFGSISGRNRVDNAIKNFNSEIKSRMDSIKRSQASLEEIDAEIETLESESPDFTSIDVKNLLIKCNGIVMADDLITEHISLTKELDVMSPCNDLEITTIDFNKTDDLLDTLSLVGSSKLELDETITDELELALPDIDLQKINSLIEGIKQSKLKPLEDITEDLNFSIEEPDPTAIEKLTSMEKLVAVAAKCRFETTNMNGEGIAINRNITALEEYISSLLKTLGLCPYCGVEIDEKSIEGLTNAKH